MTFRALRLKIAICLFLSALFSCKNSGTLNISILETTDLHGVILPYDFIEKQKLDVSLAGSVTLINGLKKEKDAVFLLDNGDNLQGQPEVYYYNFIDTVSPHFLTEAMNWIKFDAGTVGNHDIETGHAVYDRLVKLYDFPLLAANAVIISTGKPYFNPYVILEKDKIRIAVLGLVTPAIPEWLPEELYSGMEFRDMTETAKLWMPEILKEKPDLVIGLFHSGWNRNELVNNQTDQPVENGSASVAWNVPGFDIIFTGHDHRAANEKFVNSSGDTVLILNGGSRSENIAQADIKLSSRKLSRVKRKIITGKIVPIKDYTPDPEFLIKFESQNRIIKDYVDRVIGTSGATISTRDAYFGPSSFVDMIHSLQLKITGADISFAAPLSFDVSIQKGLVTVGDMFKLYRYENMLYTMTLTGEEVDKYLEFSYSEWLNTMKNASDYLLKFRLDKDGKPVLTDGRAWLRNQSYNFDSAAGINYIVDASKPDGEKVTISSFTGRRPFLLQETYKVAVNSFRGNGGGGHLTEGAGIDRKELNSRVVSSTDRDLRYYILKSIEEEGKIIPFTYNNWKIVPENWVKTAIPRDYKLLFGTTKEN
jgi:2',3'-cyclic-nucleotide 2'-phosphodiesterase/3'-nucleotidase